MSGGSKGSFSTLLPFDVINIRRNRAERERRTQELLSEKESFTEKHLSVASATNLSLLFNPIGVVWFPEY